MSGQETISLGAKCNRADGARVSVHNGDLLTRCGIPYSDCLILREGRDPFSGRLENRTEDGGRVARKPHFRLRPFQVPQNGRVIVGCRQNCYGIRTEDGGVDEDQSPEAVCR